MIGTCNACGLQVAHGARVGYKWRVERVFNSQKLQSAHVLSSMAGLGWVLFGIGYYVTICPCFNSLMDRMMRSESYRDCGCDGGNSLLIVATR